ncbi:MAG: glycerate kinase [Nitrospiraceae bacterium]
MSVRALLHRIIRAALEAVDPAQALARQVAVHRDRLTIGRVVYRLGPRRRVIVVGAGKAAAGMAVAIEAIFGRRITGGCVVTAYGHARRPQLVDVLEASHPIPDAAGVDAARDIARIVGEARAQDLLIVLLSGGASSLLVALATGITLRDKQRVTEALLRSGATIQEVNTVHKHLSSLKGGQLAARTRARIVTLILSDVLGDDLSSIGSGPTVPDPTTFADARAILRRYRLWEKLPSSVKRHLEMGCTGQIPDTPKPGASHSRRTQHVIIANNQTALSAAARELSAAGIRTFVLSTMLTGEAREAGALFGALAQQIAGRGRPLARPCCVLAGGELTVTVTGRGVGGRAQEFALSAARHISGLGRAWVIGFGTDGRDGPTDAAGAIVDGQTWARAQRQGLQPSRALTRHNVYPLLKRLRCLLRTGPTGTNVNDLYLLLML